MKDVPMHLPEGFALAAIGKREDPRDAFVSNQFSCLEELPEKSIVGTSSLRRQSQLQARFTHLRIDSLRGNVHTLLRKLEEVQYSANILAAAVLNRLGLAHTIKRRQAVEYIIPSVVRGALGLVRSKVRLLGK